MAITINQQPQQFSTVYNQMIVSCESTNTGQTDFSYIFEILDNSATVLRTLRVPPEVRFTYGVSDVARILESELGTNFFKNETIADTIDSSNASFEYEIRIGEEYDVSGTLTQFLNLASFTAKCTNGALSFTNFVSYDYTDYELDAPLKKFLTNDIDKRVIENQEGYTSFLNNPAPSNFRILTYDAAGTLLKDATWNNVATADIAQFASAPLSLNAVTLTSGTQPLIEDDTSYYEIFAENSGVVSDRYQYNIFKTCGEGAVLHFLNDLGGFDWFPFIKIKQSFAIERNKYKQQPQRLQADGTYNFATIDREIVQYHTKRTETARLNTDYLTDAEYVWLRQLVDSPEVYLELNNVFYSVIINANNYDVQEDDYDGMTFLELDIEYSVEGYRQRY